MIDRKQLRKIFPKINNKKIFKITSNLFLASKVIQEVYLIILLQNNKIKVSLCLIKIHKRKLWKLKIIYFSKIIKEIQMKSKKTLLDLKIKTKQTKLIYKILAQLIRKNPQISNFKNKIYLEDQVKIIQLSILNLYLDKITILNKMRNTNPFLEEKIKIYLEEIIKNCLEEKIKLF